MSTEPTGRPAHHVEILAVLDDAAYGIALLGRVEALAMIAARELGIEHAELVCAAVQERARRRAHKDTLGQLQSLRVSIENQGNDQAK